VRGEKLTVVSYQFTVKNEDPFAVMVEKQLLVFSYLGKNLPHKPEIVKR